MPLHAALHSTSTAFCRCQALHYTDAHPFPGGLASYATPPTALSFQRAWGGTIRLTARTRPSFPSFHLQSSHPTSCFFFLLCSTFSPTTSLARVSSQPPTTGPLKNHPPPLPTRPGSASPEVRAQPCDLVFSRARYAEQQHPLVVVSSQNRSRSHQSQQQSCRPPTYPAPSLTPCRPQ